MASRVHKISFGSEDSESLKIPDVDNLDVHTNSVRTFSYGSFGCVELDGPPPPGSTQTTQTTRSRVVSITPSIGSPLTPSTLTPRVVPIIDDVHRYSHPCSLRPDSSVSTLSNYKALMTMMNIMFTMNILSAPYALRLGGSITLVALLFIGGAAYHSCCLLLDCYLQKNMAPSFIYTRVIQSAFPRRFKFLVHVFGLLYTLLNVGLAIISMIFLWDMLENLFLTVSSKTFVEPKATIVFAVPLVLAIAAVLTLRMARWSMVSSVRFVSVLGVCALFAVLSTNSGRLQPEETAGPLFATDGSLPIARSFRETFGSIGIMFLLISNSVHCSAVYTVMENPKYFKNVGCLGFVFAVLIFFAMCMSTYYIFGEHSALIVSRNLAVYPGNLPGQMFLVLLCIGVFTSIAPQIALASEFLEETVVATKSRVKRQLRVVLTVVAFVVAVYLRDRLAEVEMILGGIAGLVNIVLPIFLFLKFFRKYLSWLSFIGHSLLGMACISVVSLCLGCAIWNLVERA